MPSLLYAFEWKFGAYPLDRDVEEAIKRTIRTKIWGWQIKLNELNRPLNDLSFNFRNTKVIFNAELQEIDPPEGCKVDHDTTILIKYVSSLKISSYQGNSAALDPLIAELDQLVMWQK